MNPPRIRTRSGRRPRARFHASWSPAGRQRTRRTLIRLGAVLGVLFAVMALGANVYAVSFINNLPSVRGMDSTDFQGDTIIKDRNGLVLADIGQNGDRRITVPIDQINPKVRQATVSIEDRSFWTNQGFDTEAILRTAATNVRAGGIAGGGSTITQQLAKQLFLTPRQTIDRKIQELVLAYQLTQTYSKRQILELYLNRSYYGEQQYGVQAAAQTYFHRDVANVDLAQAAMLAGLPQAPDAYSPVQHFDTAKRRQKEVLDAMVRDGVLTPQAAGAAYTEHLDVYSPVNTYKAPHFVKFVEDQLKQLGFKPGQQQLTVTTTLDYGKQQLAEQTVRENLQANLSKDTVGLLSSAMVAMDPKTGQILAYVGAPDVNARGGGFDFAGVEPVNPGSSVKPFTYGKALLDGKITMDTPIVDGPSPYNLKQPGDPKPYQVLNFDSRTHGAPPARVALANSLNIPAVKVEMSVGVPGVLDFYRQMGMKPRDAAGNPEATPDHYGASLTLGGFPITLLEEDAALSAYADMGLYHTPQAIISVTDARGAVAWQANPNQGMRQAVDPGVAYIIASILSDDTNRKLIFGMGTPLHLPDRHAAAKTGTTEFYHDALTIGFTPDLATVVWVGDIAGNDVKKGYYIHGNQADGVFVAAPAWHKFMEAALKGVPDRWYDMPKDVVKQGNSFFLTATPKVDRLAGDSPAATPSPADAAGIPPDPGTGPQPVGRPCPRLPIVLPGCQPTPFTGGGPPGG
jgi:membrane peptidoglycan carboxypeptidase